MEGLGGGATPEGSREAADRARAELLHRLADEAVRLDTELSDFTQRMLEGTARVAEERVEREAARLERAFAGVRAENARSLMEIRDSIRSEVEAKLGEHVAAASAGRCQVEGLIATRLAELEDTIAERIELERRKNKRRRKAAAASARDEIRDEVSNRVRKVRKRLDQHAGERDAALVAELDERMATFRGELRSEVSSAERRIAERADGVLEQAKSQVITLRAELGRIGGDVHAAGVAAEERVSQTGQLAEATVNIKAKSATAEAILEITETAGDLSRRLEQRATTMEAEDRLDNVLERLRAADERLRESDERTRQALGYLRAVPEDST